MLKSVGSLIPYWDVEIVLVGLIPRGRACRAWRSPRNEKFNGVIAYIIAYRMCPRALEEPAGRGVLLQRESRKTRFRFPWVNIGR